MTNTSEQEKAIALHAKLATVDITKIDIVTKDRFIPRIELARLTRILFGLLGLKGISVTAPNYSMAQAVDVRLPRRSDYILNAHGQCDDYQNDPAAKANSEAAQRIEAILLAAFPRHDDRSDTMTDHFDYKWSIN